MVELIVLYVVIGVVYTATCIAECGSKDVEVAMWKIPFVLALWPLYLFVRFFHWLGRVW